MDDLLKFLKEDIEVNVVVMPDFFLDRLININWNLEIFYEKIRKVAERKGGSIDGIRQTELRGGNAINTASALAALGIKVTPIICTDNLGKQIIKFCLKSKNIDFTHIKIFEEPPITTALEIRRGKENVNIMLRDVGALADFGPQHLDDRDFEKIENADYVCLFNWAGTKRFGTALAQTVFSHVKKKGKGKTYYDTADPTPNAEKIPELIHTVLMGNHVDILSLNENEATCYASYACDSFKKIKKKITLEERAKESARILAEKLSARIDLHTTSFSATFTKKESVLIPAFKVPVLRATGAGDAWNAGNILGDACKLLDEERLTLANAVAAYYISSPKGEHPTKKQLMKFCEKLKHKNTQK